MEPAEDVGGVRGEKWNAMTHDRLSARRAFSASFAVDLYPSSHSRRATGMDRTCRPGPRIDVRGDGVGTNCTLTLRSAASRRVIFLQAPRLQVLLRDGANAPPQDENGAYGQKWNAMTHQPLSVLRAFSAPSAVNP